MTAMTAAERQRLHRSRERQARAIAWRDAYPAPWGPFLDAWAQRGLRHPPTDAQLQLLAPYIDLARGPRQLGAVLGRVRRAGARHSPTTYRLVAVVVRILEQLRRLTAEARDAFDRPLDLGDPNAKRERGEQADGRVRPPPRTSRKRSPGQQPMGTILDLLRQAGLDPELAERFSSRRPGK